MFEEEHKSFLQKKNILLLIILVISILIGLKLFQNELTFAKENEKINIEERIIVFGISEKIEIEKQKIPYDVTTKGNIKTNFDTKIINEGEEGEKLIAYKVLYLGTKEIKREEVASKITKTAVNRIIERVAKANTTNTIYASRGGYVERSASAPTEYKDVLEVKATAYCLCKKCCGKSPDNPGYGVTRSGLKIEPGIGMKVIAVDPKVIPLGSKVYVEGLNGVFDYGYAVAADTGGAIKNNKIDLYMDTHDATIQWGIKSVRVYVIE